MSAEPVAGPVVVVRPTPAWAFPDLEEVWEHRELLYFLAWRDVKVRYKQTVLGVAWVLLQPILTMALFTLLFGILLRVPSSGVPYAPFAYAALVPWTFFATAVSRTTVSLASSAHVITKVYFPRILIPAAAVLASVPDFLIGLALAPLLAWVFGIRPDLSLLLVVPLVVLTTLAALGLGLWLSALNARYRDVGHVLPFALQIGMYATPVVYGSSLLPPAIRPWLLLNPMAPVVEGFRKAFLGATYSAGDSPLLSMAVASLIVLFVLLSGAVYFHRTERFLADFI